MNLSRQEDPLLLQVHEPLGRAEVRRRDDTTLNTGRQNRTDRPTGPQLQNEETELRPATHSSRSPSCSGGPVYRVAGEE